MEIQENALKKITVSLPAHLIDQAVEMTGGSIRHAIQYSLEEMTHRHASEQILKSRGKINLGVDLAALRDDE